MDPFRTIIVHGHGFVPLGPCFCTQNDGEDKTQGKLEQPDVITSEDDIMNLVTIIVLIVLIVFI